MRLLESPGRGCTFGGGRCAPPLHVAWPPLGRGGCTWRVQEDSGPGADHPPICALSRSAIVSFVHRSSQAQGAAAPPPAAAQGPGAGSTPGEGSASDLDCDES